MAYPQQETSLVLRSRDVNGNSCSCTVSVKGQHRQTCPECNSNWTFDTIKNDVLFAHCPKHTTRTLNIPVNFEEKDMNWSIIDTVKPSTQNKKKKTDEGVAGKAVFLVLILVLIAGLFVFLGTDDNEPSANDYEIVRTAEIIVKEKISSSLIVAFCPHDECTISSNGNTWTVTGWVEIKNGPNSTSKKTYTVIFEYYGSYNYKTNSCKVK